MGRNWYDDWEDEQDVVNESFGRDFVASHLKEQQQKEEEGLLKSDEIAKFYVHKNGQISLFEELKPISFVGTTKGIEYVRLVKRDEPVITKRRYIEQYIPEEYEND